MYTAIKAILSIICLLNNEQAENFCATLIENAIQNSNQPARRTEPSWAEFSNTEY